MFNRTHKPNAPLPRTAIAAAVGCGMYDDYKTAVDTMINIKKTYQPVQSSVDTYNRFYNEVYLTLYDSLQASMQDIAKINEDLDNQAG